MGPLSSADLQEVAAAGLKLASNTPSTHTPNSQNIASDSSTSTMAPSSPQGSSAVGKPTHWTTEQKVHLWNADKKYQKDIKLIHQYFSETRKQADPYRSVESLLKKRRELEAQHSAIVRILQMGKGLYWSKTCHKIEGSDPAEVQALLPELKQNAPNKDMTANRSYIDYFSSSDKLEWFSICCEPFHNPQNSGATALVTMQQKRRPGRPPKNKKAQQDTPPSTGPWPADNSSRGTFSSRPAKTNMSCSQAASAGCAPRLARGYSEFMVSESPSPEDQDRDNDRRHSNSANLASAAGFHYLEGQPPSRPVMLSCANQPPASQVPTAATPVRARRGPPLSFQTPASAPASAAPTQARVKDEEEDDGGWELLPSRPANFPSAPKRRSGFAPCSTKEVDPATVPLASAQSNEASPPTAEPGGVSVPPAPAQSNEATSSGTPIREATRLSVPPSSGKIKPKTYHEIIEGLEFSDLAQGLLAEHFRNPLNKEDRRYCEQELADHPRLRQSWLTALVREISGLSKYNLTTDEVFQITKREL